MFNKKRISRGKVIALDQEEIRKGLSNLKKGWSKNPQNSVLAISKEFKFDNFAKAMEFVNKVAVIAEREDHHPDIGIRYNKVNIVLWTHAVEGLSDNDFIVAAKIDQIPIS